MNDNTPLVDRQQLAALLARVVEEQSYFAYQSAGRLLETLETEGKLEGSGSKEAVRVALLSSANIDPFAAYVRVELYRHGVMAKCFVASHDRYYRELLNPGSELIEFQPDIVFLELEVTSLLPTAARHGLRGGDETAVLEKLDALVDAFRTQGPALIVVSNFVNTHARPYAVVKSAEEAAYVELNRRLGMHFKSSSSVLVLDVDGLAGYHGKSRSCNGKLRYLAGMRWSESFLPVLAKSYAAVVRAARGPRYKCLVVDLDNTLWGGVVGEVGADGIVLGPSPLGLMYVDFQNAILRLHERGVLLAVSSKNNRDEALGVIRGHPHMILREEHFASIQIGWDPKPEQLTMIAQDLNIGIDSLVFLDDDPVERAQVRHFLPDVYVVELPKDPSRYADIVQTMTEFEQLAVTEEDLRRTTMYAEQQRRNALRQQAGSFEDFLRGLEMTVEIRVNSAEDIERVAVLTQKTNQFNLTTRRYSQGQVRDMMAMPLTRVYTLRVRDVFGDSGLTGVAIVKERSTTWIIDTFLLSCRVIGKELEKTFLGEILDDAQRWGAELVEGIYVATAKNALVEKFYLQQGFVVGDAERGAWVFPLKGFTRAREPWVEIKRQ